MRQRRFHDRRSQSLCNQSRTASLLGLLTTFYSLLQGSEMAFAFEKLLVGEHEQPCDLLRVDLVGLGLATVDRLHVEGASHDEGEICQESAPEIW